MSEWNQRQLFGRLRNNAKSTDPITGTTENTAVEAIDLDTRIFNDSVFIIENTGSNTLYYSMKVRSEYNDGAEFEVFYNIITNSDSDELILVHHARVFIHVNSYLADNHTTYSITAIGGT